MKSSKTLEQNSRLADFCGSGVVGYMSSAGSRTMVEPKIVNCLPHFLMAGVQPNGIGSAFKRVG